MKGHFNVKTLTFYGVAIGSVLLLFNIVTAYGEAKLKASVPIGGRYSLSFAQKPNCPKSDALVLNIQQSGVYLNASLLPAAEKAQQPTAAEEKLSLTGDLSNQEFSLAGTVPSSTVCNHSVSPETSDRPQDNPSRSVKIQSRVDGETLKGQMNVSGIPEAIEFTAQKEAPVQQSESSSH